MPFEITGFDIVGPLHLRNGHKTWVCLFTCAIFRATHIELTLSLSSSSFLLVLRRLVTRHGKHEILSDNDSSENSFSNFDCERNDLAFQSDQCSDIVLFGNENIKCIKWPPGRVVKLITIND